MFIEQMSLEEYESAVRKNIWDPLNPIDTVKQLYEKRYARLMELLNSPHFKEHFLAVMEQGSSWDLRLDVKLVSSLGGLNIPFTK